MPLQRARPRHFSRHFALWVQAAVVSTVVGLLVVKRSSLPVALRAPFSGSATQPTTPGPALQSVLDVDAGYNNSSQCPLGRLSGSSARLCTSSRGGTVRALPSCAAPGQSGLAGQWRRRPEAPAFPPCCGWDADGRRTDEVCLVLPGNDKYAFRGDACGFVPVGGFGCACSAERQRSVAAYEWVPEACSLPEWDAHQFCCALGKRLLLFVGDSTQQQMAAGIINYLVAARASCTSQVIFRQGDTVIGENLGVYNRGSPWYVSAKEVGADVVVMSAYYHVTAQEGFERLLRTVDEAYTQQFAPGTQPLVAWTTSLGGVSGDALLDRMPSDIPGLWDGERARRKVYNHDQLERWDALALDFWARHSSVRALDLRSVWLRADAKRAPDDAVHFCMPGPFETVGRFLLALLQDHPARA